MNLNFLRALTLLLLPFLLIRCINLPVDSIEKWLPRPHNSQNLQVVRYSNYVLGYHEESEQPAWVLYELLASELMGKRWPRSNNFRAASQILTQSSSLNDYRGSGYDRGHLAPAADMAFHPKAMEESFYLSNISPQKPGFNRGVWKKLETLVRDWALQYQRLIIVTAGAVTRAHPPLENYPLIIEQIGKNQVWVPRYYYKIIYQPKEKKMIAFLLENKKYQLKDNKGLENFATSVNQVEKLTGLDFFAQLPDAIEENMEANHNIKDWNFHNGNRMEK